jgi:hypothetical protein
MAQLVLTSDTLAGTPATGTLEYNGQFFGTDSAAARAQMQRITLSTAVASTSGTSIDFTSIPAWVKRVTCIFNNVSTNGSSAIIIQAGISTGAVTSGYTNTGGLVTTVNNTTRGVTSTNGFLTIGSGSASAYFFSGTIVLVSLGTADTWIATGMVNNTGNSDITMTAGQVALGGTLDRIRFTASNGTDIFDTGTVNILLEG